MKIILVFIWGLFIINNVKAQENFLGYSRDQVIKAINTIPLQIEKEDKTNDGKYNFIATKLNDWHRLVFYITDKNECEMCIEIFTRQEMLIEIIKDLNNRFQYVSTDIWISKDDRTEIWLKKGSDGISIRYKKL